MYSGQLAITRELLNNIRVSEVTLLSLEMKQFGAGPFLIYASREFGGIKYYKWTEHGNPLPSKKYLAALQKDGWERENEVIITS